MTESMIEPRAEVRDERESPSAEPGHADAAEDAHGRVEGVRAAAVSAAERTREAAGKVVETAKEKVGQNPHVVTAAEKTREAADRAADAARDQVEQHPAVAATVERAVGTSGKALRAAGRQARRHPRAVGGLAAGGAVLFTAGRTMRRRHQSRPDGRR